MAYNQLRKIPKLEIAIQQQDYPKVIKYINYGVPLSVGLMSSAVLTGDDYIVRALALAGCPVNDHPKDLSGYAPILTAACSDYLTIARILTAYGATFTGSAYKSLYGACEFNSIEIVEHLLPFYDESSFDYSVFDLELNPQIKILLLTHVNKFKRIPECLLQSISVLKLDKLNEINDPPNYIPLKKMKTSASGYLTYEPSKTSLESYRARDVKQHVVSNHASRSSDSSLNKPVKNRRSKIITSAGSAPRGNKNDLDLAGSVKNLPTLVAK